MDEEKLLEEAKEVLRLNDRKSWTVPAANLYPHQWLWDSCFIAIGLRHLSIDRAQTELISLLRGQWSNGMMPNMIFDGHADFGLDKILWDSFLSPHAPAGVATSGITQPPMLAEAVLLVGQKLKLPERRTWFKQMLPALVKYHEWFYRERDPNNEGLITLLHPYESGLDNSPPWIAEFNARGIPWRVKLINKTHLDFLINRIRRDTRHAPQAQRMSTTEALTFFVALRRLRRNAYDSAAILKKPYLAVQDLVFNCVLVRANTCLDEIAKTAGHSLPEALAASMSKSPVALESLWDQQSGQYYSKSFSRGQFIEESTIASLLPLYAGTIPKEKAERLVGLMASRKWFKANWPVPSVPFCSAYFDPSRYWQGPTWINTNWLIIKGLENYGYNDEAGHLRQKTLELVAKNGMNEYFNPINGHPEGAPNFSWTAALTIDLLKN
ncbi:glycoside hydrolase [Candidatus Saccharibacteria bacterium]|nr:glycoside hydrolase [Candidatus Saccharibacteria bacterium]